MALIHSQGALEATEVQEDVLRVSEILNEAGHKHQMFSVFTDMFGSPCVINLTLVMKITEEET